MANKITEAVRLLFPAPDVEKILRGAIKTKQEDRNKAVRDNLSDIETFLESQDGVPTRAQVIKRCTERLNDLAKFAHEGVKAHTGIGSYDSPRDYPLIITLRNMEYDTDAVITTLASRDIHPGEITKDSGWYGVREKGMWTEQEVRSLSFDWVTSAIVRYYESAESSEKKKGVINAAEFKECVEIVRHGSIEVYLASRT